MRRRIQSPDIPPHLSKQVELAQEFRAAAVAMHLRCVEEMERVHERMREVRESSVLIADNRLEPNHELYNVLLRLERFQSEFHFF